MHVRITCSLISPLVRRLTSATTKNPTITTTTRLFGSKSASVSGSDILSSFKSSNQSELEGNDVAGAMESLAKADAVCFDVDSTVIQEEGIDVLANSLGKYDVISELTTQAMTGNVKFEDALQARLDILQPSRKNIDDCLVKYPFKISNGVDTFIKALLDRGTDVYFVSGGFRLMIEPVAKHLNVPISHIYANTIFFKDDIDGAYAGFDRNEPTSADLGKPKALTHIQSLKNYQTMVMIGDGATDAQAKPPAKSFIGFGGVVERQAVKSKACWFVYDFADLNRIVQEHSVNFNQS